MEFHGVDSAEAVKQLGSNENYGLSAKEAEKRLQKYGRNEIRQKKRRGILYKFFSQFKDFMIIILLISAFVSFMVSFIGGDKEYYDFIIILTIVFCNGIIGTVQEYKAEKAIDALKNITSPTAVVVRGGKKVTLDSRNVVVGDLVIVKAGDVTPADIRLIETVELSEEESSLTGESLPAEKEENELAAPNAPLAERKNMLFCGCGITSGHGKGIVTATGMDTQIGKVAAMLEAEDSPETPLQKKLNKAGKVLGIGVVGICIIIFVLGLFKSIPIIEMMMISISLAVAAIPEGLTAVVTIVLSLGVKRMAKKKAIVRKLPAVETLGGVSVICSDKTGTLTENRMTVVQVVSMNGALPENSEERKLILGLGSLCNNSEANQKGQLTGMPTEVAIAKAFEKEREEFQKQFPRLGEIPFTSLRKLMTTVHRSGDNYVVITKGAPDYLIRRCTHVMNKGNIQELTSYHKAKLEQLNKDMADKALRVLAVAKKETDSIDQSDEALERGLTFCGLIGIEDPPRKEVKKAVAMCKKAGITPVMITGDQAPTALAIAKRLGIFEDGSKSMSGPQLAAVSVEELARNIHQYRVFSRVSPEDKVKIVRAFQKNDIAIAMTGDGINDAPALKAADIGCAMGKNGTEVAKSAADMVLTDDNFATIVEAVKEGRGIYTNIRKTIHFLLSCNMGEILLVFVAFLMNLPIPLLATQILWVNLVTDSFPALALGAGKVEENIMDGKFEQGEKGIFTGEMCFSLFVEGGLIGAMALVAFIIGRTMFDLDPFNPVIGRTMCFAVLCLSQIVHSFNVSSDRSVFSSKRNKNPWLFRSAVLCTLLLVVVIVYPPLTVAFKTVTLGIGHWIVVALLSLCPLVISELEKFFFGIFSKRKK